ncbi:zf-CGNR domain-containing protein [Acidipropionibacterium acidipropionici ATCC 4875]|uniref:Zf-CGNR domain-containing protein n=1 Tax=Acidipropionibacterium acidipropionici (strain ATCC 4875 / DSM 20272 / JCM 6432 / NBRC 12425 / NCIMB 8070 / 4) TaxID=1171373 RepID=K7SL26_ACIA4|nr:CGNR zinc finger domain-containing protein [Acidipropionibacterium acidipropionici]AFV89975.1 zf-CGNR domain-containing protein [Acidipropionibacterium acidipropionici ATCC 4875]
MLLNPYGADPVNLAADLVNDPPESPAELEARCDAAGLNVDRPVTGRDLEGARGLLADWVAVVDSADEDARAGLLNDLLERWSGHPRLIRHDDQGWHLHYRDDDVTFAGMLGTLISVGTALHLSGRGMDRLGRCAAGDCDRVFADTSRNGRQKYCSTRCNNRAAVRRHRAR